LFFSNLIFFIVVTNDLLYFLANKFSQVHVGSILFYTITWTLYTCTQSFHL